MPSTGYLVSRGPMSIGPGSGNEIANILRLKNIKTETVFTSAAEDISVRELTEWFAEKAHHGDVDSNVRTGIHLKMSAFYNHVILGLAVTLQSATNSITENASISIIPYFGVRDYRIELWKGVTPASNIKIGTIDTVHGNPAIFQNLATNHLSQNLQGLNPTQQYPGIYTIKMSQRGTINYDLDVNTLYLQLNYGTTPSKIFPSPNWGVSSITNTLNGVASILWVGNFDAAQRATIDSSL